VIAYQRILGDETWTVLLNFAGKTARLGPLLRTGGIVVSNTGRTAMTETLRPYEAVVLR
jgi:hypothetical protein